MKKLTLLICIISAFAASAQVYLLPDFTLCIAKCKAGSLPLREKFNYNITSQRMEFMQDGEILELADIQMIDTVFLPGHKMIPVGNRFAEVMYQKQGEFNLLVDYKSHKINKGKKGAMGIATQGTVQNIDFTLGTSRTHDDSWKKGIDIESENIECTYYLQQGKKRKKFSDKKSLVKALPDKQQAIEAYLASQSVDFRSPASVLSLLQAVW